MEAGYLVSKKAGYSAKYAAGSLYTEAINFIVMENARMPLNFFSWRTKSNVAESPEMHFLSCF